MPQTNNMKRVVQALLALAIFMEAVDTTIINTAIPSMARSLQVGVIDLKIALISYLISLAIFIPISGWLADRFGTRKVFLSAIAIFTISSFCCGFATHLYELVLERFVQGMGGALMIPVGRLMILRLFDRTELITAMNRVIIPALIGPALGPLLGGIISEAFSWRWIFWVNIPFGILSFAVAYYWIEDIKLKNPPPFDTIGFLLLGLGLAGLVFGLSSLSESGFSHEFTLAVFIISTLLLLTFALYSTRCMHPVLRVKLFAIRTFRISVVGNLCTRIGFGGMPFLLPLFLQISLGYSPKVAGAMVALTAVGAIFIKFFSEKIISARGFKKLLLMNTCGLGLVIWLYLFVHPGTPLFIIGCFSLFYGCLTSLLFSTMNPLAYADVLPDDSGAASGVMSMMQQVASSFGVAATALILKRFDLFSTTPVQLTLADFHHTFLMLGILTVMASLLFLKLEKNDGENLIRAAIKSEA